MSSIPVVHSLEDARRSRFVDKVLEDMSGTTMTMLAVIGDRLGLFKDLEARGPATSADFAERAGIKERYAREWLSAMANSGYLDYDPRRSVFSMPEAHGAVLAHENGPQFLGGVYQMLPALIGQLDAVTRSFQDGGGVSPSEYDDGIWNGMERFTNVWFENMLVQEWIAAMPEVGAKLERGALVADVGCGRGRAIIKLAQSFPNSRYVGYDVHGPSIQRANQNAATAGVADRVRFEVRDAAEGLPARYDVITTFGALHDAANPRGIVGAIRRAMRPNGRYVCVEVPCADKLEENTGPLGELFHGYSVLYCMTASLARGGEALGALGVTEPKVRELCFEAGFGDVRRLPLQNPFNVVYEIKP